MMDTQIENYVQSHGDDFMKLLCQIISLPSPTGHEEAKEHWILQYFREKGIDGAYADAAGNILYPCQIKNGIKVPLYTAHIDTVFQDLQKIPLKIEGHTLAAPSCSDNSASVAGLLFIITMIHDLKLTLPQGILFAFDVGEEGLGNLRGIRQVMADWQDRLSEVVAVDCTFDTFVTTAVGSRRYAVTVTAAGGHSWMHFGNSNAIAAAARIISRLYQLRVPKAPKTTYNVGTIAGGTTINSIAAKAKFTVDLRSENADELDKLDQAFHAIIKAGERESVHIGTTLLGERPCSRLDANPLADRITAIRQRHGLPTTCIAGSTDANIPMSQGIPSISFGFCRSRGEHTLQESLDIDTFPAGMIQMLEFMGM